MLYVIFVELVLMSVRLADLVMLFLRECHFFGHSALFLYASVTFLDTQPYFYARVSLFWTLGLIFIRECHFFGHSLHTISSNYSRKTDADPYSYFDVLYVLLHVLSRFHSAIPGLQSQQQLLAP